MAPDRLFVGIWFIVIGLGLAVFHRHVVRWQTQYNRMFLDSSSGRLVTSIFSVLVPAGWVIVGALAFLDRLPTSGPTARMVPGTSLKQDQVAGLFAFVVGSLLLAFRGRWLRAYERHLTWLSTPAGERYMSWYMIALGVLFAGVGTLSLAGILP